jgi:nitroimidazol reductase NimA-like FMN-containing flavoprotein (pyridoxamine 5'-phosphate oxidase superfamily)
MKIAIAGIAIESCTFSPRLAYTGLDGSPRAIPIGFHWDGTRFVIGTATNSPKMQALRANPKVALTIGCMPAPFLCAW